MDGRERLPIPADIARIAVTATDLEHLARPLLEILERVTGFESTYMTVLHWEDLKQEIRFSRNTGELEMTEGVFVEWSDTLCRRALLDDLFATDDVPTVWGDSDAARDMGIVTYVSVPIVTNDGSMFGTLCAASGRSEQLGDDAAGLMELFARLLADQVVRERNTAAERERVAKVEAHARSRAMAVASAEHKVKTPLTVIRGAATALLEDRPMDDTVRRELLEAIDRQSSALTVCIEDLLFHAQPDVDTPPLEIESFALEPELIRIVRDLRLASPEHRIVLSCADGLSCAANQTALAQVLGHVVDNAVRYSPPGGDIEVSASLDESGAVAITVTDHGPGLPGEEMFRPFTRGTTSDGTSGSGLGLYIVRSLVESMNGTVEAHDAPNGGTTIQMTLPSGGVS